MPEALSLERAGALIAELSPDRGPVRAVTRFAEGSVTGAYRIDFAAPTSAPVVLKVYEPDHPDWAAKEARTLRFLTEHGIDISPRLLAFSESVAAFDGRPCVVCSLRPGRMLEELDDELTQHQRYEIYRQLGAILARLHAIPADGYGYVDGEVLDPRVDNAAHMARLFDRELDSFREHGGDRALADALTAHIAGQAPVFAECARPAYCHGDVHEPNLLARLNEDGGCTLTGLLDPGNMHAGDPLMDLVRLDAFSMCGDAAKRAGLFAGYGVAAPAEPPGAWPRAWRPRVRLYRIALALELYNWFSICGRLNPLPGLDRELRDHLHEAAAP